MPLVLSVFVAVIVLGGAFLYINLGNVAKALTEKIGTQTLGVRVSIDRMEVVPHEKRIEIGGLSIANPPGYQKPSILRVGTIRVVAESLSPDLLVFDEVTVDKTAIALEVGERGTNLSDLKKNLKPKAAADLKTDAGKPIKVIVKRLKITDSSVTPAVTLVKTDIAPITIPPIVLNGIGQKSNGVLASEAIAQVMDRLVQEATRAAATQGLLQGLSSDVLGKVGVPLDGKTDIIDGAKKDVEGLTGGLKKLF
ncbi:MAG: hypothetical protein KDJ15_03715 [Alphaproteobacteria bacterium]|nr:hypothetical protein [Alphaproteobacteria bacterium]